jgi:hypothetical protein
MVRMTDAVEFLSATDAATQIRHALDSGNISSADRLVSELSSRIILAPVNAEIPESVLTAPSTTGDAAYDTLIATALAFSLERRGLAARPWMTAAAALPNEWLWDGGYSASDGFREFIRNQTPEIFRSKNVLLRERDLIAS